MGSPTLETKSRLYCCELAYRLIIEEVDNETIPALLAYERSGSLEHLAELADGLVDSVYVLLHAAHSLGIPFDACWDEVHRSNMAKVNSDGSVNRRKDGKILKPEGWQPPNLFAILSDKKATEDYGEKYNTKGMVS